MSCIPLGELREYALGVLPQARHLAVTQHVTSCARCARALASLRTNASLTGERLDALAPNGSLALDTALTEFRVRRQMQSTWYGGILMQAHRQRVWRPILAGALVLAMLVGVFSFAPSRALARELLSIFRVKKFAVVQINASEGRLEDLSQQLGDTLFASEPRTLADEPEQAAASIEEARALAGFEAHMPAYLPGGDPRFSVKGQTTAALPFTAEGLRTVLSMADMDPNAVPEGLTEAEVVVDMPAAVMVSNDAIQVMQVYNLQVEYPDGIDPQLFGEAGLRILGVDPGDARRISQNLDWTSTFVLPVPASMAAFQEVEIAGQTGVLLTSLQEDPTVRMLLFEKDDIVYCITGQASSERLTQVAESLF